MNGASSPRVRVVVVTWDGAHLLPDCLDSLLAQDLPEGHLEVLVVDNASTDGTTALLAARYPGVRVLVTEANLGFAGGVAAGTADVVAGGPGLPEHVVLLNNDAWFEKDAVRRLVETADGAAAADERVGAVTAKVLLAERNDQGRALVNSTGNVLSAAGAAGDRDYGVPDGEEAGGREVFGLYGGASLLRAEALREVGGFDASLFLYYEDTDLSFRLRRAGWSIVYCGEAVAHHRHMASTGGGVSPLFRYYNTRNSLVVLTRYAAWPVVLRSAARQTLGALRHTVLGTEPRPVVSARWRALRDYARALPEALRTRREGSRHAGA
ncbi:glycosyltransferase family 2 protein [Antribacter gilvus]|uniref:glycosyltransferase family 2 protein n=1 Tax=Antribacter gilvus TaxID=2304675 RepID=UPI0013DF0428|nr:glycosyltransferase family 2 protein [Antribacter gilvus]